MYDIRAKEAAAPTTLTFWWTNVTHLDLVEANGQDLGIKEVTCNGNWVTCPAGWFRPALSREWADAVDVHGDRWVITPALRQGVGWL